jgi:hypothetical protein
MSRVTAREIMEMSKNGGALTVHQFLGLTALVCFSLGCVPLPQRDRRRHDFLVRNAVHRQHRSSPPVGGAGAASREDQPATTAEFDFPVTYIDCVPVDDPTSPPGSDCNASTSANTLVPGWVVAGKTMTLQAFRVRVLDVGNVIFLQQGVFVP